MESLSKDQNQGGQPSAIEGASSPPQDVAIIIVPFPGQGHLNQLLQLACLLASTYTAAVHFVGAALSNRQAKTRINGLNPSHVAKIHFHDLPTPPFASPPPNPSAANKFPAHLHPSWDATLHLRPAAASFLRSLAGKFRRIVIIHDPMMAFVVQDFDNIYNAESYAFNCISAFSHISFIWEALGKPFPVPHPRELPPTDGIITDKIVAFGAAQAEPLSRRSGDLFNSCKVIESPYLEVLERESSLENKKFWAIGPILPTELSISSNINHQQHKCLDWLDKQEIDSVIYISFGTTVSLSDEEINEIASGLEKSGVKFLWVLREADRGDVFDDDGKERRAELPEGFEERVKGVGMVVRDWAPQPEILAHASTGGFMSHCGWNSSMESLTMGVAIAAWPMHSDQSKNAALITDVLKTGIVVREWRGRLEMVKASTIESVVRRLMASEEGAEVRRRAAELGADLRQAARPGGAARLELDSFMAHITR